MRYFHKNSFHERVRSDVGVIKSNEKNINYENISKVYKICKLYLKGNYYVYSYWLDANHLESAQTLLFKGQAFHQTALTTSLGV